MSKYQEVMHHICYRCIELLHDVERITGMSYAEINVWLFIVIMPLFIVGMIAWNFYLLGKLRAIKKAGTTVGELPPR